MYIHKISSYIPDTVITNQHFEDLNGLSNEWIISRTGIEERRKAGATENTNTMAIEAVKAGLDDLPFPMEEIDLIVGATYTPYDTIVTLAHAVQHFLDIKDIPVVSISSACSSLLNAIEVVEGYFAMGKATKAVVIVSEHNTAYNNEQDKVAGHLWGDGASALFISNEKHRDADFKIIDLKTAGAATEGKATEAVVLKPNVKGIIMPHGKDVFINACYYMPKATEDILLKNNYTVKDIAFLIPHQANLRITKNVAATLQLEEDKAISNLECLGNTGCAGCAIALSENFDKFKKGDIIVVTVFGGGYSYGAMLLEK